MKEIYKGRGRERATVRESKIERLKEYESVITGLCPLP